MKQILFEVPLWKCSINPAKIGLESKQFKNCFDSKTLSSFAGSNNCSEEGYKYLLETIMNELESDLKVWKLINLQVWRNIYKNSFQDRHNHAGSHFTFIIYEKIKKPQTVFFHPASDLINASQAADYFKYTHELEAEKDTIFIFPGYLDHMVRLVEDGMSMSGNFDIIPHPNKQLGLDTGAGF
jgi:hypothetical protein|tara:strand:+ start:325 stop:873 length:549 start_codon:yes stop_codon:yes gene_type:complete